MPTLTERLHRLLRWSEKYTKTDMIYLASGGFWLSIGTAVTAFSSFILSIAFANLLPPEAYGTYKYVISVGSIFAAFTLTGLETAVTYGVSRGYEGILRRAFSTNLWWSLPSSAVAVVVGTYYLFQGNPTLGLSFILIALAQPLTASVNLGAAYLAGKKSFKQLTVFYAVDNITPALALIGVMMINQSALAVLITYFVANLSTTTLMYAYVLRRFKPNAAEDEHSLSYGKHLSLMSIVSNVADNFDKILTFHFLGAAQLAIYSFALALPSQAKLITKPLNMLLFPKLAERDSGELRKSMNGKLVRTFALSIIMTVGYIVIAPVFFALFYPRYLSAVFLSQIYAISLLAIGFAPVNAFFSAKRKVRQQYIMSAVNTTFQLAFAVIGMIYAGLLGLIIARVATRILGGIQTTIFYYFDL